MQVVAGILSAVCIIFLVRVFVKNVLVWLENRRKINEAVTDVACDKPHWLLGHLHLIQPTEKTLYYAVESIQRFPKVTCYWFGRMMVYLSCHHPDLVKTILQTDEPKDDNVYRFMMPWIGDGLLTSSGKKWKRNRRLLTPVFHFDTLKRYVVCMNDAANEMLDKWSSNDKEPVSVEAFNDVSLMTLDNLLQCIMSRKTGCQRGGNRDYLNAVRTTTEIAMRRLYQPLQQIDFIFYLTNTGRRYKAAIKTAHEYTESAVLERKSNMKSKDEDETSNLDFLDMLLMAKDGNGAGLSHQEICDEVDTFVFEGHDTVTSGISWALYNLAKHQEYQEKCREEVKNVIGNRHTVAWQDLLKLNYLTMFIKESLRLYPPVFAFARKLSQPVQFPRGFRSDQFHVGDNYNAVEASRTVPTGMNVSVSTFMLHRNPHVWKNPTCFDSLRFLPENVERRPPHAYLPFSSGPRNYIGQNFAMNEMKIALALALSRYRFTVDEHFPEPELEPFVILRSKNGIHLKVNAL